MSSEENAETSTKSCSRGKTAGSSDEKAPDSSENTTPLTKAKSVPWNKGKKRKKLAKDSTAPKQPLTGTMSFKIFI